MKLSGELYVQGALQVCVLYVIGCFSCLFKAYQSHLLISRVVGVA